MDFSPTQQAMIEIALFLVAYGIFFRFNPGKNGVIARVAFTAAVFTVLVLAYIQFFGEGLDQFILLTIFSYFVVGAVAALVFKLIRAAFRRFRKSAPE